MVVEDGGRRQWCEPSTQNKYCGGTRHGERPSAGATSPRRRMSAKRSQPRLQTAPAAPACPRSSRTRCTSATSRTRSGAAAPARRMCHNDGDKMDARMACGPSPRSTYRRRVRTPQKVNIRCTWRRSSARRRWRTRRTSRWAHKSARARAAPARLLSPCDCRARDADTDDQLETHGRVPRLRSCEHDSRALTALTNVLAYLATHGRAYLHPQLHCSASAPPPPAAPSTTVCSHAHQQIQHLPHHPLEADAATFTTPSVAAARRPGSARRQSSPSPPAGAVHRRRRRRRRAAAVGVTLQPSFVACLRGYAPKSARSSCAVPGSRAAGKSSSCSCLERVRCRCSFAAGVAAVAAADDGGVAGAAGGAAAGSAAGAAACDGRRFCFGFCGTFFAASASSAARVAASSAACAAAATSSRSVASRVSRRARQIASPRAPPPRASPPARR